LTGQRSTHRKDQEYVDHVLPAFNGLTGYTFIVDGNGKTVSNAKAEKSYKVKFDEDEDNIRIVPAHLVFAPPGQ